LAGLVGAEPGDVAGPHPAPGRRHDRGQVVVDRDDPGDRIYERLRGGVDLLRGVGAGRFDSFAPLPTIVVADPDTGCAVFVWQGRPRGGPRRERGSLSRAARALFFGCYEWIWMLPPSTS
jgi:hypothetical protein